MAKIRTRKEKQRTESRRRSIAAPSAQVSISRKLDTKSEQLVSTVPDRSAALSAARDRVRVAEDARPVLPLRHSLHRVDSAYLRADILKSTTISFVLLLILIGIYVWVRYNGFTFLP